MIKHRKRQSKIEGKEISRVQLFVRDVNVFFVYERKHTVGTIIHESLRTKILIDTCYIEPNTRNLPIFLSMLQNSITNPDRCTCIV